MRSRGMLVFVAAAAAAVGFLAGREIWPREPRIVGRVIRVEVPGPPVPLPPVERGPGEAADRAPVRKDEPAPRMKVELRGREPVLRPHGPWSERHPNGRVKAEGEYVDGKPVGTWRSFHEDGTLAREVFYRDGKLHGEEVLWHGNGVVRMRGAWRDGARDGLFTHWNGEGSIVREEQWEKGALSAPIRLWDPTGEFPPEAEALAKATVDGRYRKLLRKIAAPDDRGSYGDFKDYGPWSGTAYLGHKDFGRGYWVYVYPYWYVWEEKTK